MKRRTRFFFALFALTLALAGCSSGAGLQAPTAQATAQSAVTSTPFQPVPPSAAPSASPAPTASSTPSPTPLPTVTPTPTPTATPEPITLLFTGVIVPARCVQAAVDERGSPDYIYSEVREIIQAADLAVGTLNATLSDYPPHTGCVRTYVLVGSANNADAMQQAGFDVMSVATNHIKNCGLTDCGDRAFLDTMDNLERVGIQAVGAGDNLAEALQPVFVTIKGVRFGIVSLGMVEPMAFAGENSPGIAILNEENLSSAIAAARLQADVVIAMPHWGPEDTEIPNEWQLRFARAAVEAGADMVVGNHTHVVQAYQELDGVPVFYGLGNFVFDQNWDLAHQQGVILQLKFTGARYTGFEFLATHVDGDGTVHLAGPEESAQILERINLASEKIK